MRTTELQWVLSLTSTIPLISPLSYRDIKPENVVLLDKPSPQGYMPFAKLLDFGLSKMIGQDDGSAARTFVGTPCYLAP